MHANAALPLNDRLSEFIQSGVAIAVASRNANLLGSSARATGCRINPTKTRVSLIIHAPWAHTLLADIEASKTLAAVFCLPITEQALQMKSTDAEIETLQPGDWERVLRYQNLWKDQLSQLGFPEELAATMTHVCRDQLVVVSFTPYAIFEQTPGPDAGRCFTELAVK